MMSAHQHKARDRARRFALAMRDWPTTAATETLFIASMESYGERRTRRTPFEFRARIRAKRFAMKMCRRRFDDVVMNDTTEAARWFSHRFRLMNEIRILKKHLSRVENIAAP